MSAREAIDRFAASARKFCSWAEGEACGTANDEVSLVLQLLINLYSAALALPEGEAPDDEVADTTHEEWLRIYQRCASLPVDRYREIFNPLGDDDCEPVIATIGDDLADIHRDMRRGFQRYEQSRPENAAWEWGFTFELIGDITRPLLFMRCTPGGRTTTSQVWRRAERSRRQTRANFGVKLMRPGFGPAAELPTHRQRHGVTAVAGRHSVL